MSSNSKSKSKDHLTTKEIDPTHGRNYLQDSKGNVKLYSVAHRGWKTVRADDLKAKVVTNKKTGRETHIMHGTCEGKPFAKIIKKEHAMGITIIPPTPPQKRRKTNTNQ